MDYQSSNNQNQYGSQNQNNGYIQYNNNRNSSNNFAIASMICGIISIVLCCTVVLSLPFAALSILFAVLSRRKNVSMPGMSIAGIVTSIMSLLFTLFMVVYVLVQLPIMLNDPVFRNQLDYTYEEMYGMDFDEFWEYYGY